MDAETIKLIIQGGFAGVVIILIYVMFWRVLPRLMDANQKIIEDQQTTFTAALTQITERHENSLVRLAESMNGLKEVVAACKYRVGGDK